MQHRTIIPTCLFALLGLGTFTACTDLSFLKGFGAAQGARPPSETSSRSETHTINGRPVDADGGRDDADHAEAPRRSSSRNPGEKLGATCSHNADCASNACYVGAGELGYCTRMCDDFSDCPSFWECEKPGNAPQRICKQESDGDGA